MKRMQAIATTAAVLLSFTGGLLPQGTVMPVSAAVSVLATDETEAQKCGDNLTWAYDKDSGTLTLTGSGEMWDFEEKSPFPTTELTKLILPEGLTGIGKNAFSGCPAGDVFSAYRHDDDVEE